MKKDLSVSMVEANLYAFIAVLPLILPLCVLYIYLWGWRSIFKIYDWSFLPLIGFLAAIIIGIVVHEIIHGLCWQFFGKKHPNAIRYGIDPKTLSPYAHCQEPMKIKAYRISVAMPGVLLGILPATIGILSGVSSVFIYGLLFILAAGGDIFILWLLRKVRARTLVEDHPTRAGCYITLPN